LQKRKKKKKVPKNKRMRAVFCYFWQGDGKEGDKKRDKNYLRTEGR
jgi:hypothetical protein